MKMNSRPMLGSLVKIQPQKCSIKNVKLAIKNYPSCRQATEILNLLHSSCPAVKNLFKGNIYGHNWMVLLYRCREGFFRIKCLFWVNFPSIVWLYFDNKNFVCPILSKNLLKMVLNYSIISRIEMQTNLILMGQKTKHNQK